MNEVNTYIIFQLGNASYGILSSEVLHVEMIEHVTPVPNAAPAVDGVVFSRGNVIPALNVRARFGLPREPYGAATRLVFVKLGQRSVALIVDSAREFRRIPATEIRSIKDTLHGIGGGYVKGVATLADRSILLVDIAAVLTLEESASLNSLAAAASPVSASPLNVAHHA